MLSKFDIEKELGKGISIIQFKAREYKRKFNKLKCERVCMVYE